jgi:regulator of RNase E activity RraB
MRRSPPGSIAGSSLEVEEYILSDEWDFYFARVNDAVASIFVDLGIRPDAPIEKRPWLLWVWVEMQSARPDGLSSNEEAPKLHEIGESLEALISATCGAQLVGRITGAGRREFYFYATEPGELDAATANAMQRFDTYKYETGSSFQPDWDQYLNLLYPSESNLERMQNRRLLEALEEEGDVHEVPRKVDHWMYFADEAARTICRDTLVAIEFTVEDENLSDEADDPLPYVLVVSRVDAVDSHTINGITLELARLASENGGSYDGWGCDAMKEATLQ